MVGGWWLNIQTLYKEEEKVFGSATLLFFHAGMIGKRRAEGPGGQLMEASGSRCGRIVS